MRKLSSTLMVLLIFGQLFAQSDQFSVVTYPDQLKRSLNQMSAATSSIQADFVQEKYMEILSSKLISQGTITFKKPNMLRWEYMEPFSYVVILNNNKMLIRDDKKTNTIDMASSKTFQEINQLIIGIIQGSVLDNPQFDIQYFESPGNYKVKLNSTNKEMKAIINSIEIIFDKREFLVDRIKLLEPGGDFTNIFFKNRRLNQPVEDAAFSIH
ncbi:MAG: outer membrane lipoprotein carrier protein LolA [Cyclobacteriaceae bacterium]|nr:outer membrane lipoprotein carrier protein LolA [Cyclobacteriaceae bacterium]